MRAWNVCRIFLLTITKGDETDLSDCVIRERFPQVSSPPQLEEFWTANMHEHTYIHTYIRNTYMHTITHITYTYNGTHNTCIQCHTRKHTHKHIYIYIPGVPSNLLLGGMTNLMFCNFNCSANFSNSGKVKATPK